MPYNMKAETARKWGIKIPDEISGAAMVNVPIQLAVRPIQLWELVYPEPCYAEVMRTVFPTGIEVRPAFKTPLAVMRKILGAEKCPEYEKIGSYRITWVGNVGTYPIGVKKDNYDPADGHEQL
jgi:hypothetical protein